MQLNDKWFAIVNPVSGRGKGLDDWPLISKLLRDNQIIPEYAFTEHKYHATELVVEAVNAGYRKILIVGGDGTVHEVVNGIFIQQTAASSEILIAILPTCATKEWIRMAGIPHKYSEAIKAIVDGHSLLLDAGVVSYYKSNYKQERYIANFAGIGFNAVMHKRYNRLQEEGIKSSWRYTWKAIRGAVKHRATGMKIWVDDECVINNLVFSAIIGVGKKRTPSAQKSKKQAIALQSACSVNDGCFDLSVTRRMSKFSLFRNIGHLIHGDVKELRQTKSFTGRHIKMSSSPEVALEVDGEALGYSPLEFTVLNKALRVVIGKKCLKDHQL